MTRGELIVEDLRADLPTLRQLAELLRPYLDDSSRLLDAREKAAQLHLHPDTLVRMARAGRIPAARKIGREWRFPAGELDIRPPASTGPVALAARAPRARRGAPLPASIEAIRGESNPPAETQADAR
jgi:excisionase family DNA binding protein